jgi:hypothetical protein
MKTGRKLNCHVFTVCLLIAMQAKALILSGTGSPTYTNGWPEGAAAVSNLKSCVGWWEGPPFGGGEWHMQFRGDTEAFMQVLTNFAAIRAPTLDLVIHDGPKHDQFLELDKQSQPDTDSRVDWEFVVWNPENWNNLYNNTNATFLKDNPNFGKPVPAPRMELYIGSGQVDLEKVKVPATVRVRDERAHPSKEISQ